MSVNGFALTASIALLAIPLKNAPAQIDHSHHDETGTPTNIGRVAFPSSCSAKAQVELEKGVALLHSFWYEEATKEFEAAAGADPACAMAYWGEAMSTYHQLWENPDTAARSKAMVALTSARKSTAATPRERLTSKRWRNTTKPSQRQRPTQSRPMNARRRIATRWET